MLSYLPVEMGDHTIDAEEFVTEAFEALPFLAPAYRQAFREIFMAEAGQPAQIVRRMLKLAPEDELLCNLGERDADDALYAITGRIHANVYRRWRKLTEQSMKDAGSFRYKEAKCSIDEDVACSEACSLNGLVVPLDQRCDFPLPNCRQDACHCEWELIYPFRKV